MDRIKEVYKVTIWGSVINVALLLMKFTAGIVGNSTAMIADAIHSLTDFATDAVVLICVTLGNKPVDKSHDYGHGKYETLATAVIAMALLAVGIMIFYSGAVKIVGAMMGETLEQPGMVALVAAMVSIVLKEWAFWFTARVGKKYKSQAVMANAWHHRSDALSSVSTMFGIGGAIFLGPRWALLDPLAAVVVSIFIAKASLGMIKQAVDELTDASLPEATENEIMEIAGKEEGVQEIHNLRTRRIGNSIAIDMHVRMLGSTTLFDAHQRATNIEHKLKDRYGKDTYVNVHLEPLKVNGEYRKP